MKITSFHSAFNISIFTCLLMIALYGCAVTGDEETLITVSPDSAVVTLSATQQFSVAPAGTAVTWSVDGILGGNEGTVGKIDAAGKYTAPSDASVAPEQVVVSAADSSTGSSAGATALLTTFGANKRLTTHYTPGTMKSNTSSAGQRSISVKGDNIYVVWADNSIGSYNQVFFTMSKDVGDNFCKPFRIAGNDSADQFSPAIAVDNGNGNVYVVWEDYRDGDGDIYFSRFDGTDCNWDSTREWVTSPFTSPVKVNSSRDAGPSSEIMDSSPAIAVDSVGGVYVAWEDRLDSSENYPDIYFAKSLNQGVTFPTSTFLDNSGRRPSIAIGPTDLVYIVWEDIDQFPTLPTHIKLRMVSGSTPGDTMDFEVASGYNARFPSIAVDPVCDTPGDTICDVYVLWQRALISNPGFGNEEVKSYNIDLTIIDGSTLGEIKSTVIVPGSGSTGIVANKAYPAIAADDSAIYIVWDDLTGETKNVYLTKSSDGISYTTKRIVNDDIGNNSSGVSWHEKPAVAVTNGKAHVIWTDFRNTQLLTTISPNDVYFAVEQ